MRRLALLVLLVSANAAVAATPSLETGPTIRDCTSLAVAPSVLTIACADANFGLARMHWRGWGSAFVQGTGVVRANDCDPYCAAGHFHDYAVVATASRLRTCLGGRRQYTRLDLRYTGNAPATVRETKSVSLPCGSNGLGPSLAARRSGTRIVLTGSAWQRSAECARTVEITSGGKRVAAVKVGAKGGFRFTWEPEGDARVVVARQECHSAALGGRLFEAAVSIP
jgi:hypothetical protein